jgi:CBS domain-containing protein
MTFPYHEIVEQLTVRQILTPWNRIVGFSPRVPAATALEEMKRGRFDYVPVLEDKRVLGRAFHADLEKDPAAAVGEFVESLSQSYLVAAQSPIPRVMRWLNEDRWLLVVEGRGFAGLVTPSDLNRQAARAYFYLLVGELEVHLADVIRVAFEDQENALSLLNARSRYGVRKNHAEASTGDIDSDYVAAMTLRDLFRITSRSDMVQALLPDAYNLDWDWVDSEIGDFRNKVMHVSRPLLSDTDGLPQLIEIEACLRLLAAARPSNDDAPATRRLHS